MSEFVDWARISPEDIAADPYLLSILTQEAWDYLYGLEKKINANAETGEELQTFKAMSDALQVAGPEHPGFLIPALEALIAQREAESSEVQERKRPDPKAVAMPEPLKISGDPQQMKAQLEDLNARRSLVGDLEGLRQNREDNSVHRGDSLSLDELDKQAMQLMEALAKTGVRATSPQLEATGGWGTPVHPDDVIPTQSETSEEQLGFGLPAMLARIYDVITKSKARLAHAQKSSDAGSKWGAEHPLEAVKLWRGR